jgi:hypothetical protein
VCPDVRARKYLRSYQGSTAHLLHNDRSLTSSH